MDLFVDTIRLALRRSRLLFAVSALLILASVWLAKDVAFEFSLEALFQSDSPETIRYQEFMKRFGEDNRVIFIAYKTPNVFERADREAVARLAEQLTGVPGVLRVFSLPAMMQYAERMSREVRLPGLYDAEVLHRDLTTSPVSRGLICSADGTTSCLILSLADDPAEAELRTLTEIRAALDGAREATGIQYHLAGIPVIEAEYGRLIRRDFFTLLPLSILVVLILLAMYFRNLTGTVLLLGTIFAAIAGTLALLRLFGIPIGILTNMVPTLILVVGLSESIHVLSHYHEETRQRRDTREAVAWVVFYMAGACFLTSVTNALGFGTMMFSDMHMMREFGYATAAGIFLSYLAAVVLLPTLLDIVPAAHLQVRFGDSIARVVSERMIRGIGWVNEHGRRWVYGVLAAVLVFALWGMTRIQVRSSWLQDMRRDGELYQAHAFIDRNLSAVFSTDFWIQTDGLLEPGTLAAIGRFESALTSAPGFEHRISYTGSIVNLVRDAHALLAREEHLLRRFGLEMLKPGADLVSRVRKEMLAFDLEAHRIIPEDPARLKLVRDFLEKRNPNHELLRGAVDPEWKDARLSLRMMSNSKELGRFIDFARTQIPADGPLRAVHPTGKSYMAKAILDETISGSLWSTLQLAVVLLVMFAAIFRSWGVGLMAMTPNLIPPVVTAGIMGAFGFDLNYSTVTTFAITLGLTVENTVQYLLRYRVEILKDGDYTAAMYRALAAAGKPMVFSNLLLMCGFSVAMFSSFRLSQTFGLLGVVSIGTATLAEIFVTSSLPLIFKPNIRRWQISEIRLERLRERMSACFGAGRDAGKSPAAE